MKYILIEPGQQAVTIHNYVPIRYKPHYATVNQLLGGPFRDECCLSNGDLLFSSQDSIGDPSADAFEFDECEDVIYGRSVIVRFDLKKGCFKDCTCTVAELSRKISFYSRQETVAIRTREVYRLFG
jgi:hypothetical protein